MSDNISSGSKLILKLSALLWNRNPTSTNTESNVSSTVNEIAFDNIDDERNTNTNKCMGSITDDYLLTNQYVAVLRNIESQIPLNVRDQWRNSNNGLQIIESLSYSQIINHLLSLRCEYIHKLMRSVVVKLINHPRNANLFNAPVDPILLKVPDYFSKIKNPMDLGTVRDNLVKGNYESIQQCANDIKLTFENATTFNGPQHNIHLAAKELLTEFYEDYNNMEEKSKKEIEKNNLHDCEYCIRNSCNLCGEKCLKLEPPTLICHGTCSQRIKRNTMYYISIDGIFVWCLKCYSTLPQRILELPNRPPIYKKDLLTRKADEEIPEPIIQCNKCHQYSHQICALYNPKSDSDGTKSPSPSKKNKFKAESNDYRCPLCILKDITFESPQQNNAVAMSPLSKKRARNIEVSSSSNEEIFTTPPVWKASSLPKSKLSIFLETFVKERLDEMGHGSVKDTITIRMVSNAEHCIDVPMHITQNFMTSENNKIPPQIGYKQKCILLFQNIDGIDVCLFCLYVHEFDESVPLPNKSCVYIAYLDSIDYFRPLEARTYVYHEIVVGYLKWAQVRGFKRCHIWSCPPQRGDNFIFWCHPSHQKTPSRDRLNAWYNAMLLRATEIGIVGDVTTMWDAYFIQYSKKDKDESNTRLAAKNSLIGSGTMLKRTNSLPSNLEDKSGTTLLTHLLTYSLTHSLVHSAGSNPVQLAPISPPIFEGDLWLNECSRVYKMITNRTKSTTSSSSAINGGLSTIDRINNQMKCKDLLKGMLGKPLSYLFKEPVDPVALNIPDYFNIIKFPMDLGTIKSRVNDGIYTSMFEFCRDVKLCYNNAMVYNPPTNAIYKFANAELKLFQKSLLGLVIKGITYENNTNQGGTLINTSQITIATLDKYLTKFPLLDPCPTQFSGGNNRGKHAGLVFASLTANVYDNEAKIDYVNDIDASEDDENNSTVAANTRDDTNNESYYDENDDESSEAPGPIPLRRADSLDSVYSCASDTSAWARRPFNTPTTRKSEDNTVIYSDEAFVECELGYKGALGMMNEISKNVNRLKDDLFVITFTSPVPVQASNGRKKLRSNSIDKSHSSPDLHSPQVSPRSSNDSSNQLNEEVNAPGDKAKRPTQLVQYKPLVSSSSQSSGIFNQTVYNCLNPTIQYKNKVKISSLLKKSDAIEDVVSMKELSPLCQALVRSIASNTTDPDPIQKTLFVDTRHVFLEMCQFLHYQFDTLRRSKHSSLMLLYHLHHPDDDNMRPTCVTCDTYIRDVRFHCDVCHTDLCSTCFNAANPPHPHALTPFRVTLIQTGSS